MKKQVITIRQVNDSRLMFDKKPPSFGIMLITITAGLIILALIFANIAVKTLAIETQGVMVDDKLYETYLSEEEKECINIGDSAWISLYEMSWNEYRAISGEIVSIDNQCTEQGVKVVIKLDSNNVVSFSGKKINIEQGMKAYALIQYGSISFYDYLVNMLSP